MANWIVHCTHWIMGSETCKKGSDARALHPWASTDHRESYNLILRRLHHIPILRQRPALWRRVTACYRAHSHRLTWVKGRINTTERIIQEWIRSERSNPSMNAVATWWCDVRDISGEVWALLQPSINPYPLYEGIDRYWVDRRIEEPGDQLRTGMWCDYHCRAAGHDVEWHPIEGVCTDQPAFHRDWRSPLQTIERRQRRANSIQGPHHTVMLISLIWEISTRGWHNSTGKL